MKSEEDLSEEIAERKKKITSFLRRKKDWGYSLILAILIFIGVYIRTRNISRLKDITTGTWTLGPDLDPFLFLRWAKEIVANGSLFAVDTMRYVPLGYNTAGEMKLLSYLIAWFHQFLSFFSKEVTVTYSAVIFPGVMFGLAIISFFLFSRKVFYKRDKSERNIIALIATTFFAVIPSLLPRTIAGIPEKESASFFFIFMAFYLFLEAFTNKDFKKRLIFGGLSGIATGLLALIWGGVIFVFLTIPIAVFLSFILGKIKKGEFIIYSSWLVTSFAIMIPSSTRYTPRNLIISVSTSVAIGVFILIVGGLLIIQNKKLENVRKKTKLSKEIFSCILSGIILLILSLIAVGPTVLISQVNDVKNDLITPINTRFGMTVAENKQPYFVNDWKESFGPVFHNIPIYFWLLFAGSVVLFNNLVKNLKKKERILLTSSYLIFLFCLIFSRYSSSNIFDGISNLSLGVYFGGGVLFLGCFRYVYHKKNQEKELEAFKEFEFSYILYFIVLTLGIIGARGGIRLIMILGAISPVAVSFLIVKTTKKYFADKGEVMKFFTGLVVLLILTASVFTLYSYYKEDIVTAQSYAPGPYQWQWQKTMEWVRENTPQNAVFAHWWDYGYWLQSIGERATILDGGNSIVYWNHFMGRYVLTGTNEKEALEFLYTHNATHLLIDSTDIGKYTAFSSIGADENYDRFSWIPTFLMDKKQTHETNNETLYVYIGGTLIDDDISFSDNGKKISLPKRKAGVGAIILKEKNEDYSQPQAIFVYKDKQYLTTLRYLYVEDKLYDFGSGLDAGVFVFPELEENSRGKMNVNPIGAMLYLSNRTVHSNLANLYLFNKKSEYFRIVHVESNLIVNDLKNQGWDLGEFVYYNGLHGPINIWEIKYPSDIKENPKFLETKIPDEINKAQPGEY